MQAARAGAETILIEKGSMLGGTISIAAVDYTGLFHAWGKQISLCMSNPELYTYWETQARKLHQVIGYKKVLLSMDEIRNGGGCVSCRERGAHLAAYDIRDFAY